MVIEQEQHQEAGVLTPRELAARLKLSVRSINRAAAAGRIEGWRAVRVGARYRFIAEESAGHGHEDRAGTQ